jgi:hypothetical protein
MNLPKQPIKSMQFPPVQGELETSFYVGAPRHLIQITPDDAPNISGG